MAAIAPLADIRVEVALCVMLLLLSLLFATDPSHAVSVGLPSVFRAPSSDDLKAIGKRCQIGIWWSNDTIILEGIEPVGQEREYKRRRDCASRLIKRAGFKATVLVD